jgi:protocatechuate 3,4-dioxygenase beta subunit
MFVEGRVTDTKGNPIAGAVIDTWETDGSGLYDTQVRVCTLHNHYLC